MSFTGSAVLAISLSLLAGDAEDRDPTTGLRIYSPWKIEDLDALAVELKKHVAFLKIQVGKEEESLDETAREGYGAVLSERRIAVLPFLVEGAAKITVQGPKNKRRNTEAWIILYDVERRVAILETRSPLSNIGLFPATPAPKKERAVEDGIYVLVATLERSGVMHGTITDLGDEPEYEGHPRIDLKLTRGMPIFDDKARLLGYARSVSWDLDQFMIVPYEVIEAARTATTTAEARRKAKKKQEEDASPWWVR